MREHRRKRIFNCLSKAFWILEILELLLAGIILGLTGSASQGFTHDLHYAKVPGKLIYNTFIAALTLLSMLIMIPLEMVRPDTWGKWNMFLVPWPRVAVNVFFAADWAGALGSAWYTCSDICSAADANHGCLTYATLSCDCSLRQFSLYNNYLPRYIEQRTDRYEATQAMDALILAAFVFSIGIVAAFHWVKKPPRVSGRRMERMAARSGDGTV